MRLEAFTWYHGLGFVLAVLLIAAAVIRLRAQGTSALSSPEAALEKFHRLASLGRFTEALKIGHDTLAHLPPPDECQGRTAEYRFVFAMLVSDIIRKSLHEPQPEYDLLKECDAFMKRGILPSSLVTSMKLGTEYLVQMNLGNAASKLRKFAEAADAHHLAALHAKDAETRSKSLVYEAWDLLRLQERDNLPTVAANVAKVHDLERDHRLPPAIRSSAVMASAAIDLYGSDLTSARNRCVEALSVDPTSRSGNRLEKVLDEPNVTSARALAVLLELDEPSQPPADASVPIAPLPPGA